MRKPSIHIIMKDNIPGYPGYHVTKDGKVYSRKLGAWVLRKPLLKKSGYLCVRLNGNKGKRQFGIHQLVAMVYIPNPNNYPLVMHLDDNPTNNKVENLKWGTYIMNTRDAISKGRLRLKGENNPNAKLSDSQVNKIRKLYYDGGYTQVYLAKKFKVAKVQISRIIRKIERG